MNSENVHRSQLNKSISSTGLFSIAFGSMIGVGWVTAMGSWLYNGGPVGAMVAFVAGGFIILCIGFCYAEVTSLLPVAGGEVAYAYKSFGVSKSFIVGWFLSFGYLSVSAFEAISIGKVLSYLFPLIDQWPMYEVAGEVVYGSHVFLAFIFTALITWVNYRGVQTAARFQLILTFLFILLTIVFIVAALLEGSLQNMQPAWSTANHTPIVGILGVMVTVPFWFVGFDTIPQSAEEASFNVSNRTLGKLIVVSIISAVSFYILIIFAIGILGNRELILQSELPTAAAFELALQSSWLAKLILVAALIGLMTSWNGFFLAGSRVLFSLGRGRILSKKFGWSHSEFKTPYVAILFSGVITFLSVFMGRGAMLSFVNVGSFCIALAFAGVSLSYLKLKSFPFPKRPYEAPGGRLTGYLALVGSLFILLVMLYPGSSAALSWPLEWIILSVFSGLGVLMWRLSSSTRASTGKKERDYFILEEYGQNPQEDQS